MKGIVSSVFLRSIAVLWFPHQVFTQCSVGCASCNYDGSICHQCERSYWLQDIYCVSCPYNCETCTNNFTCQSCKPGFYNANIPKKCQNFCSSNCTLLGCAGSTGYCYGCPSGWYGSKCVEPCNLCIEELCDLRKCTNGCKDGYYQDVYDGNYNCRSCVKNECIACLNGTYCTQCNDGFYVTAYMTSYRRGEADCQKCLSADACENCDSGSNCSKEVSITKTVLTSTKNVKTVTITETTSITQTKADVTATEHTQTDLNCRCSLGPAIGGSIAGGFAIGVLASAVVFYLRERCLLKLKDRKQSENTYYNMSMETSHQEEIQSVSSKDVDIKSRQCEATFYEKLSEQNKANIYDHLDQRSLNEDKMLKKSDQVRNITITKTI